MTDYLADQHLAAVRTTYAWLEREIEGAREAEEDPDVRLLSVIFDQGELDVIMRQFRGAVDGLWLMRGPLVATRQATVTRSELQLVD